jgi:hypothetical protein
MDFPHFLDKVASSQPVNNITPRSYPLHITLPIVQLSLFHRPLFIIQMRGRWNQNLKRAEMASASSTSLLPLLISLLPSLASAHGAMLRPLPRNSIDRNLPPWNNPIPLHNGTISLLDIRICFCEKRSDTQRAGAKHSDLIMFDPPAERDGRV